MYATQSKGIIGGQRLINAEHTLIILSIVVEDCPCEAVR